MNHREPFSITPALHTLEICCSGSPWCRAGIPGRKVSSSSGTVRILKISLHKSAAVHLSGTHPTIAGEEIIPISSLRSWLDMKLTQQGLEKNLESLILILTVNIKFSQRYLYIGFVYCLNLGSGWLNSANLASWGRRQLPFPFVFQAMRSAGGATILEGRCVPPL